MKEERSKPEIIRSVADGDKLELVLSEVNEPAFRNRASELNKTDGYKHYRIASNSAMNTLMIIAEKKKEDESGS